MLAISKNLVVFSLGSLLVLAPARNAHAADAPLSKALLQPSEESEVVPRRASRPLSRHEIFRAIELGLAQKGLSGERALRPQDLRIQSSLPDLDGDMGLEVKSIGYDPIRRETVFELWASHEPQYLPFKVTTRIDPQSLGLSSVMVGLPDDSSGSVSAVKGKDAGRSVPKPPVLARPGTPATLVMLGQNLRVTLSVEPLQPGTKGQCIRVRDLSTSRVMNAQVIDEGLLEASF